MPQASIKAQTLRQQGSNVTDPIRQIRLGAFLSHGIGGPADWMSKQKKKIRSPVGQQSAMAKIVFTSF
jgi:hypothetical protein